MFDKVYLSVIGVLGVVCLCQQYKINSLQSDIIDAQEVARTQTVNLNNEIERISKEKEDDQKKADATISNLRKRVASYGVYVKSQSVSSDTSATASENGCKLSREFTESLISISERGDRAIRDLNKCIDQYNAVRDKLNERF